MDNVQYNNLKDLLVRLNEKIDGLSSRRPTGWDSFIITSVDADIDPLVIEYYKAGGNIGNANANTLVFTETFTYSGSGDTKYCNSYILTRNG